jgi:hypothetical protein
MELRWERKVSWWGISLKVVQLKAKAKTVSLHAMKELRWREYTAPTHSRPRH